MGIFHPDTLSLRPSYTDVFVPDFFVCEICSSLISPGFPCSCSIPDYSEFGRGISIEKQITRPDISSPSTASSPASLTYGPTKTTLENQGTKPRSSRLHRGGPAPLGKYRCSVCQYSCSLPKDLERHMVRHFGLPDESCYRCPNPGCGKLNPRRHNGLRHTRLYCKFRVLDSDPA